MQTINISLKAFDGVYLRKAYSEIVKILFYMDHCPLKRVSSNGKFLSVSEKKDKTLSKFKFFSYPKTKTIYTVIRSPHIDKKSREQFEFNNYKSQIIVTSSNFSQVSLLLFFLKNCGFTGVELNFSVEYSTFFKI